MGIDVLVEAFAAHVMALFLLAYVVILSTIGIAGICFSLWTRYPICGFIFGLFVSSSGMFSTASHAGNFGVHLVLDLLVVTPLPVGIASIYLGVTRMERARRKAQNLSVIPLAEPPRVS